MKWILLAKSEQSDSSYANITALIDDNNKVVKIRALSSGASLVGFGTKTDTSINLEYGIGEVKDLDLTDYDFYLTEDEELPTNLELYVGFTNGDSSR